MLRAAVLIVCLCCSAQCAEGWKLHFEADKGGTSVTIPNAPMPLEKFLFEPPAFSTDPLGSNAVISNATIRKIGIVGSHSILEVQSRVHEIYYAHLYLLLVEVKPGRYLPIYGQQYGEGNRTAKLVGTEFKNRKARLQVRVDIDGTGGFWTLDEIVVNVDDRTRLRLSTERKH